MLPIPALRARGYVNENSNRENLESLTANGKHQIQVENSPNVWKMSRYRLCKLILIDKTGVKPPGGGGTPI